MLKEVRGFSQQLGLLGGSVTPMRINSFFFNGHFRNRVTTASICR